MAAIGPGRYKATRAATSSKLVGASERNVAAHRGPLELEDPDGIAPAQHLEGPLVIERHAVYVGPLPCRLLDQIEGHLDHRQVAQAEEVHLQQAEVLDAVHLVLGDDRCIARVRARLGLALHRQVLGERLLGDDDRGGMDAVLAPEALEPPRHVDHELRVGVLLVHLTEIGCGEVAVLVTVDTLETGPQRGVPAHHERGHGLGDLVAEGIRQAEDTGPVAHGRPCLDCREGDDLGDVIGAVALGHITDHLAPASLVEVHVDVGHLLAARVQEPLEEKVVADRVEIDDAKAVGDTAARGRATPGTDPDPRLPRVVDDVPDDEEIAGETHLRR